MPTKNTGNVSNDAQLLAIQKMTDPETLLDVMLRKFSEEDRDDTNVFYVRIVLAGLKSDAVDKSLEDVIVGLVADAVESADQKNVFLRDNNTTVQKPTGLLIEYDDCFIQLLEGVDSHVFEYIKKLNEYCQEIDAFVLDACILFFVDDVTDQAMSFLAQVDKVPGSAMEGECLEKTDEEISEMITECVSKMVRLCSLTSNEPKNARKNFLDSARVNYPLLFPRVPSIKMFLKKTDLFFTLKEYVEVFGNVPHLTRDVELNHPVEDPLKY